MPSRYEVWLCTDLGQRLKLLNDSIVSFEYLKVVNDAGPIRLTLNNWLALGDMKKDRQIQIWRAPSGGDLALDALGFVRWWNPKSDGGKRTLGIKAPDQNELLKRRIAAYFAGTAQATVATNADDAMKDIFNENFIGGAAAARDWSGNDLTVQADLSAGTSLEKEYAWRTVLDVLQDLNFASRADGNEVFFGIAVTAIDAADDVPQLQFQTWTGQPGQDRTWPNGVSPVRFGEKWGNLEDPSLEFDYRDEVNYVYALGRDQGSDREKVEVSDSDLINGSAWGRREGYRDARHVEKGNTARLTDEANTTLAAGRPRLRFSGRLLDTQQARYGKDWFFGDKVTAAHAGYEFDAVVRSVRVSVDEEKKERIDTTAEAEIVL